MSLKIKIEYFDAFLEEISKWYVEENGSIENNDLSKLKVLKLLFLGVAKENEYLKIFDNFVAWDLGPVEKDVYDAINKNRLSKYIVTNSNLSRKDDGSNNYGENAKKFSKGVVEFLKGKNADLINLQASKLVDITHKWNSWVTTRLFGISNISNELLIEDKGYYS